MRFVDERGRDIPEGHDCCPHCGATVMRLTPADRGWRMNCAACGREMLPVLEVLVSTIRPKVGVAV